MSRTELKVRLRERRDTALERWATARQTGWGPARLLEESSVAGDRGRAARGLARHLIRAPKRFVIHPSDRPGLVRQIHATFPAAAADAAAQGDRIRTGRYDLLGYRALRFGPDPDAPDWHLDPVSGRRAPERFWTAVPYLSPEAGDHKVIWELNRHQHWLALGRALWLTGDQGYQERFTRELRGWLVANPPYRGINWASMLELAFRSLSWIWALHLFASEDDQDPSWIADLLGALESQLDHIARHLSWYFSPNTHLLGEGLALYVAGRTLPFLARSGAWDALGRRVLLQERTAQVLPDGGHAERSLHYHRYALDFYLLALAVARRTDDVAAGAFEETARRMAVFARAVADDTGRLMTIGDDDGGMLLPISGGAPWNVAPSLSVAAALLDDPTLAIGPPREEALWMAGTTPRAAAAAVPSIHFPETGYSVLRDGRVHIIFDTGAHGFLNGGHAHADALAVTASVDGRPLLIDPGTATYTMDPEIRDRFRSTAMHNTVMVDGRDQSTPRGPFHWSSRTDARLARWISAPGIDYAEGEHLAYAPVRHRRAILRVPGLLFVADHLLGEGSHAARIHWHVDPGWQPRAQDGWIDLQHTEGARVALGCTAGTLTTVSSEPRGAGWIAPVYGQLLPSLTLRSSGHLHLPATVVTAIAWDIQGLMRSVRAVAARMSPGDAGTAGGVLISDDRGLAIALFTSRWGTTDAAPRAVLSSSSGELTTDARAALLRLSPDGVPESLTLLDASMAEWSGEAPFVVERPMAELLHLDGSVLRQLSRTDEPRSVI